MQIDVAQDAIRIRRIPPLIAEFFREIPRASASEDPKTDARLYPDAAGEEEPEIREDWRSYVVPGLRETFADARNLVDSDLATLRAEGGHFSLTVPLGHAEAWLNALNQARLALAAQYGFGEKELADDIPESIEEPRDRALFQIHFYGMLQEWFIRFLF